MGASQEIEEIGAKIGGQEFHAKGLTLNTLVSLISAVAAVGFGFWLVAAVQAHSSEAKTAGEAFVKALSEQTSAIKEQTVIAREANCLNTYQGPPDRKQEFCKQVTR